MVSSTNSAVDQEPPSNTDGRQAVIAKLTIQIQSMVEQSGNPDGFDAQSWLNGWLRTPLPAFACRPPLELLDTTEGVAFVSSILARIQSGAFT